MNPDNSQPQPSSPSSPGGQAPAPNPHPMVVLQPGEHIVCEMKRHPIGILSLYVSALIGMAVTIALAIFLPKLAGQYTSSNLQPAIYGGVAIIIVLLVLILGVATYVY